MRIPALISGLCVASLLSIACGDDSRADVTTNPTSSASVATVAPTTDGSATTAVPTTDVGTTAVDSGDSTAVTTAAVTSSTSDGVTAATGDDSTAASTGPPGCELKVYPNIAAKHPIDLMLYVDSSSSLGAELKLIDSNIDMHLLLQLQLYEVDYRVLVVSAWPHACLPPLDCAAPQPPTEISADGRILYVSIGTGSSGVPDGYHSFIDSYWAVPYAMNAVEPFLREDSVRVIFGLTDGEKSSNADASAAAYELELDTRLGAGRYTVHTVSGFNPAGIVGCMAPLQGGACKGKNDSGPALKAQQISIDTCGLRASVCGLEAGPIFEALAQSSVSSSVQCDMPIPNTNEGDIVVPENVEVDLVPGMGPPQPLQRVDDEMSCVGLAFYVEGNVVHLCPEACAAAKADLMASLEIRHCVAPG